MSTGPSLLALSVAALKAVKPAAAPYVYTYADVCQACKKGNQALLELALFGDGFNLNKLDKAGDHE